MSQRTVSNCKKYTQNLFYFLFYFLLFNSPHSCLSTTPITARPCSVSGPRGYYEAGDGPLRKRSGLHCTSWVSPGPAQNPVDSGSVGVGGALLPVSLPFLFPPPSPSSSSSPSFLLFLSSFFLLPLHPDLHLLYSFHSLH